MANNPQSSGRLQATLEDMKRRLEEEREAAELLTRRLNFHRESREQTVTRAPGQPIRTGAPIPGFSPLENELNRARKQLQEQKAITEKWIEQVTTERDAGRARLREAQNQVDLVQAKLAATEAKLLEERAAAEGLIAQLMANQAAGHVQTEGPQELDALRQQLGAQQQATEEQIRNLSSERDRKQNSLQQVESRAKALDDQLLVVNEQRQVLEGQIAQLAEEREHIQAEAAQAQSRSQALNEELAAARAQLDTERHATEAKLREMADERQRIQAKAEQAQFLSKQLDEDLAKVRGQLDKERQAAEAKIKGLTSERERVEAEVKQARSRSHALDEELAAARAQLDSEREAAEVKIREITAERDESRSLYDEVDERTKVLEQEFVAAHEQFREQREAALRVIRQMELDREENQIRVSELQSESIRLQEEVTKARNDLKVEASKVVLTKQIRHDILDAVVEIQEKGQKLLDLLQAWSGKDAEVNLEAELPEAASFFERGK